VRFWLFPAVCTTHADFRGGLQTLPCALAFARNASPRGYGGTWAKSIVPRQMSVGPLIPAVHVGSAVTSLEYHVTSA
jgi:hypothetical protein